MAEKKMTKKQLWAWLMEHGDENVRFLTHSFVDEANPTEMMRGLKRLVDAGIAVSVVPLAEYPDELYLDGRGPKGHGSFYNWSILLHPEAVLAELRPYIKEA